MDTDDLTEEAYEILPLAAGINDYLKTDLGVMSYEFGKEDEYLKGMLAFILAIKADPVGNTVLRLLPSTACLLQNPPA